MEFKEDEINNILAKWDLAGVSNVDPEWPNFEYKSYIIPMIDFFNQNGDVFDYVKKMFEGIIGEPSTKDLLEIRDYSDRLNQIIGQKK